MTAVGLGLGVAFLVKASADDDLVEQLNRKISQDVGPGKADSACHGAPVGMLETDCASFRRAQSDRRDDAVVGVAGLVVAGVGAASLVTTWLMWPASSESHDARIRVIPVVGGGVVRGIF